MNLDNPSWQGIGVLVSVFGIAVAGIIYWLQKPKRKISFYISESQPLLAGAINAKHDVEILSNGEKLINPQLLTIRIQNSGRNEIEKNDFSEPIQINFGKDAKLHSSSISSTTPEGFSVALINSNSSIQIEPLLLNRGDAFEFQCLITGSDKKPEISARVKGVSKLSELSRAEYFGENTKLTWPVFVVLIATLVGLVGVITTLIDKLLPFIFTLLTK
jgi:hypothetical protein